MTEKELKPCPFCGSTDLRAGMTRAGYDYVACMNCFAEIRVLHKGEHTAATEKAWNRRAEHESDSD